MLHLIQTTNQSQYHQPPKKDEPQKFVNSKGVFNKVAEENAKVKTTKNYLEGDAGAKIKEEANIEKPKWVTKRDEPGFVDFNKNEDLMMRNMDDKHMIQNVYSEPRDPNDPDNKKEKTGQKKQYKPRTEFAEERQYYTTEKKVVEPEYDSDGFEIVGTEKVTGGVQKKTYKRDFNNDGKKKKFEKRDQQPTKGGKGKENFIPKEDPTDAAKRQLKSLKEEVKITVDTSAKKLKDLFG